MKPKKKKAKHKSTKLLLVIVISVFLLFLLISNVKISTAIANDVDFTFESHSDFAITSANVLGLVDDQSDNLHIDLGQLPAIALSTTRNNLDFVTAGVLFQDYYLYRVVTLGPPRGDPSLFGTVGLWRFTGIDITTPISPVVAPIRVSFDSETGVEPQRSLSFQTVSNASFFRQGIMLETSSFQNNYMIKLLDLETPITDDDFFRFEFFDIGSTEPFFNIHIFEFNATGGELFYFNATSSALESFGTVGENVWFELKTEYRFIDENSIRAFISVPLFGVLFQADIPFSGWNGLNMVNISIVSTNGDIMEMRLDWIQFGPVSNYQFNDGFGWISLDLGIDINPTNTPIIEISGSGFFQIGLVANDYSTGTYINLLNNLRLFSGITTFTIEYLFNATIFNARLVMFFKTNKTAPFAIFNSISLKHLTLNWSGAFSGSSLGLMESLNDDPSKIDIGEIGINTFDNSSLSIFSPAQKPSGHPPFRGRIRYFFRDLDIPIALGSIRMTTFLSQSDFNTALISFTFTAHAQVAVSFQPTTQLVGEFIDAEEGNNLTEIVIDVRIWTDFNPSNDTGFVSNLHIDFLTREAFVIIKMTDFLVPVLVIIIPSLAVRVRLGKGTFLPMILVLSLISMTFGIIPLWIALLVILLVGIIFVERLRGKGENFWQ